MKRIRKLDLLPNQILSTEDMQVVNAGAGYVEKWRSWPCGCTKTGDVCNEYHYYEWESNIIEDVMGIISTGPYLIPYYGFHSSYYMIYPKKLRKIKNGTKDHMDYGTPQKVYKTIIC